MKTFFFFEEKWTMYDYKNVADVVCKQQDRQMYEKNEKLSWNLAEDNDM